MDFTFSKVIFSSPTASNAVMSGLNSSGKLAYLHPFLSADHEGTLHDLYAPTCFHHFEIL